MHGQNRPLFVGIDRASGPDQHVVSVWTVAGRGEAKRLPPQPNDTRLARAVGRAVKRLRAAYKAARSWARYNLRFVRAGRYDDELVRTERFRQSLIQAQSEIVDLRRDYLKFMADIPHAPVSASASLHDEPWDVRPAIRTTVHFETLNIQSPLSPAAIRRRDGLADVTVHLLRHHARTIAAQHADRVENQILAQTAPAVQKLVKGTRS